jgi:hypothetical protein
MATLDTEDTIICCQVQADPVHRAEPWGLRGYYCRQCGAFYEPSPPAGASSASFLAPVLLTPPEQMQVLERALRQLTPRDV